MNGLSQGFSQLIQSGRLGDDAADAELFGGSLVFRADIARGHQDGKARTKAENLSGQIKASHSRHGEVRDHGGEVVGSRAEIVQRSGGIEAIGKSTLLREAVFFSK
jgi:hypothetical protein